METYQEQEVHLTEPKNTRVVTADVGADTIVKAIYTKLSATRIL